MANRRGKSRNNDRFYFLGLKITVDSDCSYEIKRGLLLQKKAMITIDSILKSKDITLPTKTHLVKAMVFLVVMYRCESWTIKKAEHQRINAFKLWCWGRLLRVPWTAQRSNQSILKKSNLNTHWKDWWWSWSSNTLATWCDEPAHWKRLSLEETLMLGKTEGTWRRGQQRMRRLHCWLNGHEFEQTPWDSGGQGSLMCCSPWGLKELDMT